MRLYRSIDVWKRLGDERLVRYRCFEVIPGVGFCVQSADFYNRGMDRSAELDQQAVELLIEQAPEARSRLYGSIEDAIEAFDREFA